MRLVMLTQFYPPIIGGIERHVRDLSIELARRGHEVAVITLWQDGLPEYEEEQGVRIYRIRGTVHRAAALLFQDAKRSYAPPFPDPEMMNAMRRIIQKEKPQIIHAHNWLVHSFLPLKGWSKAKLVVTLHDYGLRCPKWTLTYNDTTCSGPELAKCAGCLRDYYGVAKGMTTLIGGKIMTRIERSAADMFIPVSTATAEGNGVTDGRVPYEVIPNFIPDTPPSGDIDAYIAHLPPDGYLLFVGAFGRHKGFDILLKAYRELADPPPLVLIGYEIPGFALASVDMPANTHVFKHWPNAAVMEAWRRSSIALIPSNWPEPSPTVVMEAMAAQRPVIASCVGGITDIVDDGHTGLLVPPGDVPALTGAIRRLLDDPALRTKMGLAGKEKVVEFTANRVVSRLETVYGNLV